MNPFQLMQNPMGAMQNQMMERMRGMNPQMYDRVMQMTSGKTESQLKEIFEGIHKVLLTHCKLNNKAMCAVQSLGYNGFKRWHRYRGKSFFDLDTKLANELYDKFRIKADFKDYEVAYSPSGIEEHLKSWQKAILDGIQELGTLGKDFYETAGMNCGVVDCAMKKMGKDYEKVSRYIKRFTESDWLTLDMHIVDDKLHDKYKAKEEGKQWNPLEVMLGKK